MKALKLKSSPDHNPVWGQVMLLHDKDNYFLLEMPSTGNGTPHLFSDPSVTLDMISLALHPASEPLADFELVNVEVLVKR